jgi:Zn-dependent protease
VVPPFPNISLGRIAGIRVEIGWSWLLIFALIAWTLERSVFPRQEPGLSKTAYVAMGLVAAFLYLVSVLLHELGHALQARREGLEVDGITLWLLGGVSRFRGGYRSPGAEFRTAIAGPLATLIVAAGSLGLAQALRSPAEVHGGAAWLGYMNAILFVFNMLPALPLDGGRVLHALLWRTKHDPRWATRIAADAGRALGSLLMVAGIAVVVLTKDGWGGIWLVFVGWFLVQAARAERATVRPA